MSALADFLQRLFAEGRVVFTEPPIPSRRPDGEAVDLLRRAYADYRLEVAGPRIDFDADTALAAADLVRSASWFLVHRGEPDDEVRQCLAFPGTPATPAQHLSADLVLRYLPQVHRRAGALAPDDVLPALLADVLRRWPLSGILADVAEGPLTPPELGGHPGLMLLYAERLAAHDKPAWLPSGRALEYVDLVFERSGRKRPAHPQPESATSPQGNGHDGD
jgi:hypothetical protein